MAFAWSGSAGMRAHGTAAGIVTADCIANDKDAQGTVRSEGKALAWAT